MSGQRVLVCGGRDYHDPKHVRDTLDALHKEHGIALIIHGGADGADNAAKAWSHMRGIDQVEFPANWSGRGKAAGPHRNALMLRIGKPGIVLAFPGGRGTANMLKQARTANREGAGIAISGVAKLRKGPVLRGSMKER